MSPIERKKRLGQYFTSNELAKFVAALSHADDALSIIDPMAGKGDMLTACFDHGAKNASYGAVEIDKVAWQKCVKAVPSIKAILGNAFHKQTIDKLVRKEWELVITNPPYVRYQSLSDTFQSNELTIPSGDEVRNGLIEIIESNQYMTIEDRLLFVQLAKSYSGLADLAVPCWLLCASLCAPKGKLALILPESWLSREYAAVVKYLLLRWFRVLYIVEDADASWFSDVQVKTNILIAERVERRESAFNYTDKERYLHITIYKGARSPDGLLGNIFEEKVESSEKQFSEFVHRLLITNKNVNSNHLQIKNVKISAISNNLKRHAASHKWLKRIEGKSFLAENLADSYTLHPVIQEWLLKHESPFKLTTLDRWNIKIGQGLRTGANKFFYTNTIHVDRDFSTVDKSSLLTKGSFKVVNSLLLPVLRKQTELPYLDFKVDGSQVCGRVIAIRKHALSEDIEANNCQAFYKELDNDISNYIREIDTIRDVKGRRIRDFSAVSPNIRKGDTSRDIPARFWYMLPELASRHKPDVFIARVNTNQPKAYVNIDRELVIDANFSTIWSDNGTPSAFALVALFNSSWFITNLEYISSIMGGGALKVEATHLKRLPIPFLSVEDWKNLDDLGQQLTDNEIKNETVLNTINNVVISSVLGRTATGSECYQIHELGLIMRQKRHKTS